MELRRTYKVMKTLTKDHTKKKISKINQKGHKTHTNENNVKTMKENTSMSTYLQLLRNKF